MTKHKEVAAGATDSAMTTEVQSSTSPNGTCAMVRSDVIECFVDCCDELLSAISFGTYYGKMRYTDGWTAAVVKWRAPKKNLRHKIVAHNSYLDRSNCCRETFAGKYILSPSPHWSFQATKEFLVSTSRCSPSLRLSLSVLHVASPKRNTTGDRKKENGKASTILILLATIRRVAQTHRDTNSVHQPSSTSTRAHTHALVLSHPFIGRDQVSQSALVRAATASTSQKHRIAHTCIKEKKNALPFVFFIWHFPDIKAFNALCAMCVWANVGSRMRKKKT